MCRICQDNVCVYIQYLSVCEGNVGMCAYVDYMRIYVRDMVHIIIIIIIGL